MNTRRVSLLRGINVGGHNLVPMTRLREIYASLGCEDVQTYLQSGNVVYRRRRAPSGVDAEVEAAIRTELSMQVRVIGRTHDDLARIVGADPFPEAEPAKRLVLFLESLPGAAIAQELGTVTTGRDRAILIGQEFHLHCPDGIGRTKLTSMLSDRRLGVAATGRNWRTVTQLLALSADQS
ncbi:MAG: DUF1697 domain-containing protein [Chloroflexota bacterium]